MRQKFRKLLLMLSMVMFPVTLYYFSPVLIIGAGLQGIISGSFFIFISMLLGSIIFGRLFCAYVCPAGGLQEYACTIIDKMPKRRWRNYIKYAIWLLLLTAVIYTFVTVEFSEIDFFYQTNHGISVSNLFSYIVYYGIILVILISSLIAGKRAFCHYFCWMAPFFVTGIKLRRFLHLPGLSINKEVDRCILCNRCSVVCPMSLDLQKLSDRSIIDSVDCILCGSCVDYCPEKCLYICLSRGNYHGK